MMRFGLLLVCMLLPGLALAEPGIPALTLSTGEDGSQSYSLTLQILALMTVLTLLPAALLMMTSFTRIIIVLAILRQAMGVQSTPSNQIMIGLALFLTFFIMSPVFSNAYETGVKPYLDGDIEATQAIEQVSLPFREFMLAQTRESDIELFAEIGGYAAIDSPEEVPFSLLLPAFVTSELKTAFQIGFLIFVPFLIIDLVVASVLMAMGMMMLSPMLISLPFKLMLFVLIDGWALLMGTLASSFYI
ncbi:MAG: flagellar type III secretion system pore protein FliP [Gammaproteobacteria bacterium]|jgi:flagellar biosynthetic protein FliP|nr:flagellar type III secretion system pore protein FliP [Gammaproteobacteria bacterium]